MLAFFGVSAWAAPVTLLSATRGQDGKVTVTKGYDENADAWVSWADVMNDQGWNKLHLSSNGAKSSENQMYCVGYLDTYVSSQRVYEAYTIYQDQNGIKEGEEWPASWVEWTKSNIQYIDSHIDPAETDYWNKIRLIIEQFNGMLDGYNANLPKGAKKLSKVDFWIFQAAGDFEDIAEILTPELARKPEFTKCSGLVKMGVNNSDIYFAQDTWSEYRDLHAYLKDYDLHVKEFAADGIQISFSTRTGRIGSNDDFWTSSKGLLVLETTMHNFNNTLKQMIVPQAVLTWIRSYYAMLDSSSGEEWTRKFILENSGTYNNQYVVLDHKLFEPGKAPGENLLWMIEQLPRNYHRADISKQLADAGWFGSVNAPNFTEIFTLANYSGKQAEEPWKKDFWSYLEQPRYLVMVHHAPNIKSYEEFKEFMRYNDWKHDKDIEGLPEQGILSRYDLRNETGTRFGKRAMFGGLDTKAAAVSMLGSNLRFDAINSPEYKMNPAFTFKDWPGVKHPGLPERWLFSWKEFGAANWTCERFSGRQSDCLNTTGCGYCLYSDTCLPAGSKDGPAAGYRCEDGWGVKAELAPYAIPLVASVSSIILVFVGIIYFLAWRYSKKQSEYDTLN